MNVRLMVIEWNAQGEQVRRETMRIRAHKEPVLPKERFERIQDGVWQEQRRGKACLTLSTWTATEAANGS